MKYNNEVCELSMALKDLISAILHEESQIPAGFTVDMMTDHLKITADIKLDIGLTEEGEKEFREQFGSATPFKMIVRPEDLNNGK